MMLGDTWNIVAMAEHDSLSLSRHVALFLSASLRLDVFCGSVNRVVTTKIYSRRVHVSRKMFQVYTFLWLSGVRSKSLVL